MLDIDPFQLLTTYTIIVPELETLQLQPMLIQLSGSGFTMLASDNPSEQSCNNIRH